MVNISNRDRARSIANAGQLTGRVIGTAIGMAATAPVEGAALAAAGRVAVRGVAAARAARGATSAATARATRAVNAARSARGGGGGGSLREPLLGGQAGNRAAQTVRRNTSVATHSNRILREAASSVHQTVRHVARQMTALGVSSASRSIGRAAARGVSRILPSGVHSANIARAVGEGVTELAAKTGRSLTHAVGEVYGRGIRNAEKYFRGGAQDGYHELAEMARSNLEGKALLLESQQYLSGAAARHALKRAQQRAIAAERIAARERAAAAQSAMDRQMGMPDDLYTSIPVVGQEAKKNGYRSIWHILFYGE